MPLPRLLLLLVAGTLFGLPLTHAASIPPDAGQSMRDIEQRPPQLPPRQQLELELPASPAAAPADDGRQVPVSGFSIEGNSTIASGELLALLADLRQRSLTLTELQEGAGRITRHYRERGYPLARAYLPAQDIGDDGMVRIAVLEGHYGEVRVERHGRISNAAVAPLAALRPGDAVRAAPLEHSLLLLQETPGVEVESTLRPGATVGTTDLLVEVRPGPLLSGAIDADNFGNRYTGAYRLGATVNLDSPLGLGDRLTLRAMGSDEDQRYYRAAYQLPVGPLGTRLGLSYSDMDYQLARDFDMLDARGNARIFAVQLAQPLVRARDFSLSAGLEYADKRLRDEIGLFASRNDKRSQVLTASLSGTSRDDWLGGGVNSFALELAHGRLQLDDEALRLLDSLTARSRGGFTKLNPSLLRLQRLDERFSFYAQLQGQWADGNLDSSEKFSLGGAYGVRAYPQGEASGDEGWLARLELRYALSPAWQLAAFADHGAVRINKKPWSEGDNHRQLSGAGISASWSDRDWQLNAMAAWKLGGERPESDSDRSPRVWLQVVRRF
ncbi:ShlB/FhaC/HecB family hemolysin secretion/activation protein [Azoarcus indigens]|uniref:Hemolysin activation/secretion protein n=1 Tax=Azoarcus indigens TaxID=29545 RepID=A0A4R6DYW4_9RHOO|nr:ShlB/FhaC/HecB family hemolysin secretion/activation protein [Azoarcus indigens]NMG68042.1 ShlB/FhaC/HecB family hemolysin secretion/activation protein [Azoarcus indigens]TDN49638.1 hemolysin activation/secretion protein [Azoarcus indigens]